MRSLILLGGPTGVGKTTTLRILEKSLENAGCLDADDVWRVSGTIATPENGPVAIDNVIGVMRGYFRGGCETGVLSWVFARPQLYEPVIAGLSDVVDAVRQIYLVASPETIRQRIIGRRRQNPGDDSLEAAIEYAVSRVELIDALPFDKIDTTGLTPSEVALRLAAFIHASA